MSYYYVKSPGAGSPSGTTKQTGSWPAAYYASIVAAITGGAGAGDVIVCSDSHSHTYGAAAQTYNGPTSTNNPLEIVSVSDTACDTYSAGATEATPSTYNLLFYGVFVCSGMSFDPGDLFGFTTNHDSSVIFNDCTIQIQDSGSYLYFSGDGQTMTFNNCDLDLNQSANFIRMISNGCLYFNGGRILATTGSTINDLFYVNFTTGGGYVEFNDADISVVSGATQYILGAVGGAYTDDQINVVIRNCKIGASTPIVEETFVADDKRILLTNSSSSSAAAEYQYYYNTRGGIVEDDSAFYRNSSTAWPSGTRTSLKVDTNSYASHRFPFRFEFPTRYAALSSAATDSLKIYLVCADSLTNADVWVDVWYMDGTNKQTPNATISLANAFTEMRSTPSALTSNSDAWTGVTSENKYEITIDTSGDAGSDCVPVIMVYVAKETIIYFDTDIDLS